jgi:hypothetical protein
MVVIHVQQREIRIGLAEKIHMSVRNHTLAPAGIGAAGIARGHRGEDFWRQGFAVESVHIGDRQLDGVRNELQPQQMICDGQPVGVGMIRLVIHLVTLHVEDAGEVKCLGVIVLPEFPHVAPVGGSSDGQAGLTGRDLGADLNAELAQLAKRVIWADVIVRVQIV